MLERFKVPKGTEVRVSEASLREATATIFQAVGVPRDQAKEGADVLVMTDLRGVETHGVSNGLRLYVELYKSGRLNPDPKWSVVRESPGTAVIEADAGLGIMLGRAAMNIAMEKARAVGTGFVTMRNSGHPAAVGHFATIAAESDMIGVCATCGGLAVPPTFGAEKRVGTNPIGFAAPAGSEAPMLFDVATTTIALNKVILAQRVGATLLPGWIADRSGVPIMEEVLPPETGDYMLLPLGGTREQGSHKGYGFALMTEVLGSLLADDIPAMLEDDPAQAMHKSYFMAYDIAAFTDLEVFKERMDGILKTLRETPPAPGAERVLYVVKTSGTKGEPLKRATWTLTGSGSSQICQPPFG